MSGKSKVISGLSDKNNRVPTIKFSEKEKRKIVEDYLSSGASKRIIWYKYTGRVEEHGKILSWMRELGYVDNRKKSVIFAKNNMSNKPVVKSSASALEFENLQLKKRVEQLEKHVQETEMKAIAFSTMVDIAEREFNISIRKKYNTKPSKK